MNFFCGSANLSGPFVLLAFPDLQYGSGHLAIISPVWFLRQIHSPLEFSVWRQDTEGRRRTVTANVKREGWDGFTSANLSLGHGQDFF